mmetsp:Transcript_8478/g.27904  ORF Transcript_8478/g.27904 Transcript_8478/m.27904 type:complete len:200 (-) Transcript_8478:2458-3057(-)
MRRQVHRDARGEGAGSCDCARVHTQVLPRRRIARSTQRRRLHARKGAGGRRGEAPRLGGEARRRRRGRPPRDNVRRHTRRALRPRLRAHPRRQQLHARRHAEGALLARRDGLDPGVALRGRVRAGLRAAARQVCFAEEARLGPFGKVPRAQPLRPNSTPASVYKGRRTARGRTLGVGRRGASRRGGDSRGAGGGRCFCR